MGPWLTHTEAAEYMRLKPSTLAYWRARESGPPYSRTNGVAGTVLYHVDQIDAWLLARTELPLLPIANSPRLQAEG